MLPPQSREFPLKNFTRKQYDFYGVSISRSLNPPLRVARSESSITVERRSFREEVTCVTSITGVPRPPDPFRAFQGDKTDSITKRYISNSPFSLQQVSWVPANGHFLLLGVVSREGSTNPKACPRTAMTFDKPIRRSLTQEGGKPLKTRPPGNRGEAWFDIPDAHRAAHIRESLSRDSCFLCLNSFPAL